MAKHQMRPSSRADAPDPSHAYERSHPSREAGAGRLDNDSAAPADHPDRMDVAVKNKQKLRQINAEDETVHSMKQEEPLGEDQAPMEKTPPRRKRHPRTEGRGGTP
jgi:hypothetical protein